MAGRPGPCGCGCGNSGELVCGYVRACYTRWVRAGRPESGPPPPMSDAARMALANAGRTPAAGPEPEPDAYDLAWKAAQHARREALLAAEPELRADRGRQWAAALVRCVAASDAEGIRLLLHRVTDWPALAVVLAECCDPARTAVVTGQLTSREEVTAA